MTRGIGFWAPQSTGGGGPATDLSDYLTGMMALWGIKRGLDSYGTGKAINVRRSSDNDQTDILFNSDGSLDTASLLSFTGSGDAYVVTAYDQSAVGLDITAPGSSNQPRIVNAGTYDGYIVFDGVDDCLVSVANHASTNKLSCFIKGVLPGADVDKMLLETDDGLGGGSGSNNASLIIDNGAPSNVRLRGVMAADTGNILLIRRSMSTNGFTGVITCTCDLSQNSGSEMGVYINGSNIVSATDQVGSLNSSQVFTAGHWNIGARAGGTAKPSDLKMTSVACWSNAYSATDVAAINALL